MTFKCRAIPSEDSKRLRRATWPVNIYLRLFLRRSILLSG